MKFSDLENGMAVRLKNGDIGMVYKGFMTYVYIMNSDMHELISVKSGSSDEHLSLNAFGIVEVKSVKSFCNGSFLKADNMYNYGERIWTYMPTVVEMTMEDVCKALGKQVKIVK